MRISGRSRRRSTSSGPMSSGAGSRSSDARLTDSYRVWRRPYSVRMDKVTITLPSETLGEIDAKVDKGDGTGEYDSRSEAIRELTAEAIRLNERVGVSLQRGWSFAGCCYTLVFYLTRLQDQFLSGTYLYLATGVGASPARGASAFKLYKVRSQQFTPLPRCSGQRATTSLAAIDRKSVV